MTPKKKKVFDTAVKLFNTKGYHGTSIRDIATNANVNVSMISYYFGGKKELLEQMMTFFLEGYIEILDQSFSKIKMIGAKTCLLEMIHNILKFKEKYDHLARLVYREITLDTVLVREIMMTYLAKERYYLKSVLELGIKNREFRNVPVMFSIMKLKSLLMMPYLQPQYLTEVLHIQVQEEYFTKCLYEEMEKWIEEDLCQQKPSFNEKNHLFQSTMEL